MQLKTLKKTYKQNLHKVILPKLHHFIAELMMMLETDLAEIKLKSQAEINQLKVQKLNLEKKAIVEMLSKLVDLVGKLNKFLQADKDETVEISMIEDDKKIIEAFLNKMLSKNLYE